MLSFVFQQFYENWMRKAEEYGTQEVKECFDKFFTLYVVYNRLYAEMTFLLGRRRVIPLEYKSRTGATKKITNFPDTKAAKTYINTYLGSRHLVCNLEQDNESREAISEVCRLIENEEFYIKLDVMTGCGQREVDLKLLDGLRSTNKDVKGRAILDLIYSIRCNMFHGHKGFNEVQVRILRPTITILQKLVNLLYEKLSVDED